MFAIKFFYIFKKLSTVFKRLLLYLFYFKLLVYILLKTLEEHTYTL